MRHFPRSHFPLFFEVLKAQGYTVFAPVVTDGHLGFEVCESPAQMTEGLAIAESAGHFSYEVTDSPRFFAWAKGPQSLKAFLFAPEEPLWTAKADNGTVVFTEKKAPGQPVAVIGARACDLAALKLQDAHFLHSTFPDPYYRARRENLLVVAVNCTHPGETCFCASTGDGPTASNGYDLVLDELEEGFLLEAGSDKGQAILSALPTEDETEALLEAAMRQREDAKHRMQKTLRQDARDVLLKNLSARHWEDVASRCLSCSNCTAVCPTCFCHREHDVPDFDQTTHIRVWDSCFTKEHSYIHGFVVRPETAFRYRQWITHKLAFWQDQYGRSGCVGCGRCITHCPVGIDITEEVEALAHESLPSPLGAH